jgi:hypothetical protein
MKKNKFKIFRHDISIITRDYHLLGIPIDQQPDILIDWITSMLIFDLNTKLDINLVRHKVYIKFFEYLPIVLLYN